MPRSDAPRLPESARQLVVQTHAPSGVGPRPPPDATNQPTEVSMDMKLEVVVLPVTDAERAKQFYESLGWRLDADVPMGDDGRLIQMTPPGSPCSVQFGVNVSSAAPGSAESVYLVVDDIEAAREDLAGRGVEVSEVFHEGALGDRFHAEAHVAGPAPERSTYG